MKQTVAAAGVITSAPEDGAKGDRGMLPYPTGDYFSTQKYTSTKDVAPFVLYEGTYYVMNKITTWLGTSTGKTPAQDYAANGVNATWIPFENFKAIYVELLFAKFGLLGSGVFYDDYLFSQYGVKNGIETSDYSGFADGSFKPNLKINFRLGEIEAMKGTFWGNIKTPFTFIEESDAIFNEDTRTWKIQNNLCLATFIKGTRYDLETIELPNDIAYNGSRIIIHNPNYPPYTRTGLRMSTTVKVEGGGYIRGTNPQSSITIDTNDPTSINFIGATVEFLATPAFNNFTGEIQMTGIEWVATNYK